MVTEAAENITGKVYGVKMNMRIAAAVLSAPIMYMLMCLALNLYFESGIPFPKRMLMSDKKGTVCSVIGAICTAAVLIINPDIPAGRAVLWYGMSILLGVIAVIDLKTQTIPNKLVLYMLLMWGAYIAVLCIYNLEAGFIELIKSAAGFIFSLLVFGTGYIFMRNKLGGGDVKLALVLGLILTGDAIFGAMIYSFILSFLFALTGIIIGKLKPKDCISFAPFIFLGTMAAAAIL